MWRFQWAMARSRARGLIGLDSVDSTVVVVAAAVVVVELGLPSLLLSPAAAVAAVAMPANASRSPQARIERRKSLPPQVDCKSEAERAG
jgi:hypothetical protein